MSTSTELQNIKINPDTGEIDLSVKDKSRLDKTDQYMMFFLEHIGFLQHLSKTEIIALFGLMKFVSYDTNDVVIVKSLKEKISKNMDMKIGTIDNAITGLVKKEALYRVGRGHYQLNAHLFAKGNIFRIKKLKQQITWDFENHSIDMKQETVFFSDDEHEQRKAIANKPSSIEAEIIQPTAYDNLLTIIRDKAKKSRFITINDEEIDLMDNEVKEAIMRLSSEHFHIDNESEPLFVDIECTPKQVIGSVNAKVIEHLKRKTFQ